MTPARTHARMHAHTYARTHTQQEYNLHTHRIRLHPKKTSWGSLETYLNPTIRLWPLPARGLLISPSSVTTTTRAESPAEPCNGSIISEWDEEGEHGPSLLKKRLAGRLTRGGDNSGRVILRLCATKSRRTIFCCPALFHLLLFYGMCP